LHADLSLPDQVGPWSHTGESRLSPEALRLIEPDAYLLRE
jgi:hypothetical protein